MRTCHRLALLLVCALGNPWSAEADDRPVDFTRDVRPILSDNCFQCHGPDAEKREADLRLDTRDGLLANLGDSAAVVPGQPAGSAVYQRITATDPDQLMPPASSGKKLSPQQVEVVRRWIEQGAKWSTHWAFQAPVQPALPAVQRAGWVRNPVDALVLARLEAEGLQPAPEADKVTLLRRLSLDLIGLPPTIAEIDAFVADGAADAYDRQVARLLESPHYGERWGRHWLDAARYADSDGYEKDKSRRVWAYRDWVVEAHNRDLPYDQFIIEQLAGDLLPDATQDQLVATGFLRNSMINEEGGIDPEQFRMEAMFDRMDAIGKSILGLTIQCGQCHSHKYDPLTHEEYYRIFAFLNDANEGSIAVYTADEARQRSELFRQIRAIEAELQRRQPDWAERMAAWEERVRGDQPAWLYVQPAVDDISTGGQKYLPLDDGSFLAQGYAPTKHRVKLSTRTELTGITAFRLELLNDPNLPLGGPGRSILGTSALTEFEVDAAPASAPDQLTRVKIAHATADVEPPETPLDSIFDDKSGQRRVTGPVAFAIDGVGETAWGLDVGPGRRNQPRKAVFQAESPVGFADGTWLVFYLSQQHGGWNSDDNQNHNLGRFRLSITTAPGAQADPLPARVREILTTPADQRSPAEQAAVFSYWRTTVPEWQAENARIEELWRQHPPGTSQLVLTARERRRPTFLLQRGDFLKPTSQVEPGVPAFLHPLPAGAEPTRLTFARWLVDRRSPTAARAIVNRVWQAYFGIGLVGTSEDLGSQGELPSHPELLDWLAVRFMETGWRLKELHRWIVSSATYRQSSRVTEELYARDPYNRLLARGPRFRVEAEIIRDIALAASGLLNPKLGGPSLYPPAPSFLFEPPVSYGPKIWDEAKGSDRYRRALYTFRYRSVPYPMLQTFDAPNGDFACVRRVRSNTPLQALTTLNEDLFVDGSRALAQRAVREGGSAAAERLDFMFRLCVARRPDDAERQTLLGLLARQTKRGEAGELNPWELIGLSADETDRLPPQVTAAELAGWTAVARVILNLDETITKE